MHRRLHHPGALPAFIAGLAACGGSSDDEVPSAPVATVSCQSDARLDHYTSPNTGELDKMGDLGAVRFRFFDLQPSPPAKGNNTFHVAVENTQASQPAPGGLRVELRMPDHGHGTSVQPVITPDASPGAFTVAPLYLFMPGVWRLEFEALDTAGEDTAGEGAAGQGSASDAMLDRAVLHFCIEG